MKQFYSVIFLPVLIILLLIPGVSFSASSGTYFYWDDVRALQIGMTKQEVVGKLGKPYQTSASNKGDKLLETYVWSYVIVGMYRSRKSGRVSIKFLDGKVISVPTVPEEYRD